MTRKYTDMLPEGWSPSDEDEKVSLTMEFRTELPPGHLLANIPVDIIAHRCGTDDILCQHVDDPDRFTVVHLSWVMKQEWSPDFPYVEVDGTFDDFLEYERGFLEIHVSQQVDREKR